MKFFLRATWIICLLGMLAACGQKGRLVLPVRPPPVSTPYPTAQPKEVDGATKPSEAQPDLKPIEN